MGYINPNAFKVDYAKNTLLVDGMEYHLKNSLHCAAAAAILSNRGATREVQLYDAADGLFLLSSLDQLVNTTVRQSHASKMVDSASLAVFLGSGMATVAIINGESIATRFSFTPDGLAGFLTVMTFLQRYILQGITIVSPHFDKTITDSANLTLSTVVDGKTFTCTVESGLVTSVVSAMA